MQLFDIVRKLNDEISASINEGMPGRVQPKLTGITDGYTVLIHFVDLVVWSSENWEYSCDPLNATESDLEYEIEAIEAFIRKRVMEHVMVLFNIQW